MNANFGLLEPLPGKVKKEAKKDLLAERAQARLSDRGWRATALRCIRDETTHDARAAQSEVEEFLTHLAKETGPVPHTVRRTAAISRRSSSSATATTAASWSWDDGGPARAARAFSASCSGGVSPSAPRRGALGRAELLPLSPAAPRRPQRGGASGEGAARSTSGCRPISIGSRPSGSSPGPKARAAGDEFGPTRDLAILELFYSTGIRLSELSGMNLDDLDLLVRPGQGARQGAEGANRAGRLARVARPPALS